MLSQATTSNTAAEVFSWRLEAVTCMIFCFFYWIWKFHFRPRGRSQRGFGNKPVKEEVKFICSQQMWSRDAKHREKGKGSWREGRKWFCAGELKLCRRFSDLPV